MYVDTDDYEALNARICQVLEQLQDASCLAACRRRGTLVAKLYELSAYCDHRVSALQEGERQLQQRQSALTVDYLTRHVNSYLIKPGAGRVHLVGMLGAGVGGSFRFDAVEATLSSSVSILSATLNARVGEVALKGQAHASLLDADGDFDPQLIVYAQASATLAQASLTLKGGNSLLGASVRASGSLGVAYAEAEAVLSAQEQTLKLKAGAAAVQGEVQCAFELFGAKVTITGSGSLGSAQAELTYSHKNREWEFGSKLGFIAGLGFHVKVEY